MKRVLRILATIQGEWAGRADQRTDVRPELASGLKAYAARQVAMHKRLAHGFHQGWKTSVAGAVRNVMNRDGDELQELLGGAGKQRGEQDGGMRDLFGDADGVEAREGEQSQTDLQCRLYATAGGVEAPKSTEGREKSKTPKEEPKEIDLDGGWPSDLEFADDSQSHISVLDSDEEDEREKLRLEAVQGSSDESEEEKKDKEDLVPPIVTQDVPQSPEAPVDVEALEDGEEQEKDEIGEDNQGEDMDVNA
ncbi:hypothetical protein C8R43DRAFT_1142901 [Mycena crocata]|nr:hypothetical protein C8R43DRAFT_1142901 [Mycena crocata]